MSAPPLSAIPAYVLAAGPLLLDTDYPAITARCRAMGAVLGAIEFRTGLTHLIPDEGTWQTLRGHCYFHALRAETAAHYQEGPDR